MEQQQRSWIPAPTLVFLPQRSALAGAALRMPDEEWAIEARRATDPASLMDSLGGIGNVQTRPPPPLMAPIETQLKQLAEAIDQELKQAGRAAQRNRVPATAATGQDISAFFGDDAGTPTADDEALFRTLNPHAPRTQAPMYHHVAELGTMMQSPEQRGRNLLDGTQVVCPPPLLVRRLALPPQPPP